MITTFEASTSFQRNICRTCLRKISALDSVEIYSNKKFYKNQSLKEVFNEITKTLMDPDDMLPIHICQQCSEKLKRAVAFKRTIEKADQILRHKLRLVKIRNCTKENDLITAALDTICNDLNEISGEYETYKQKSINDQKAPTEVKPYNIIRRPVDINRVIVWQQNKNSSLGPETSITPINKTTTIISKAIDYVQETIPCGNFKNGKLRTYGSSKNTIKFNNKSQQIQKSDNVISSGIPLLYDLRAEISNDYSLQDTKNNNTKRTDTVISDIVQTTPDEVIIILEEIENSDSYRMIQDTQDQSTMIEISNEETCSSPKINHKPIVLNSTVEKIIDKKEEMCSIWKINEISTHNPTLVEVSDRKEEISRTQISDNKAETSNSQKIVHNLQKPALTPSMMKISNNKGETSNSQKIVHNLQKPAVTPSMNKISNNKGETSNSQKIVHNLQKPAVTPSMNKISNNKGETSNSQKIVHNLQKPAVTTSMNKISNNKGEASNSQKIVHNLQKPAVTPSMNKISNNKGETSNSQKIVHNLQKSAVTPSMMKISNNKGETSNSQKIVHNLQKPAVTPSMMKISNNKGETSNSQNIVRNLQKPAVTPSMMKISDNKRDLSKSQKIVRNLQKLAVTPSMMKISDNKRDLSKSQKIVRNLQKPAMTPNMMKISDNKRDLSKSQKIVPNLQKATLDPIVVEISHKEEQTRNSQQMIHNPQRPSLKPRVVKISERKEETSSTEMRVHKISKKEELTDNNQKMVHNPEKPTVIAMVEIKESYSNQNPTLIPMVVGKEEICTTQNKNENSSLNPMIMKISNTNKETFSDQEMDHSPILTTTEVEISEKEELTTNYQKIVDNPPKPTHIPMVMIREETFSTLKLNPSPDPPNNQNGRYRFQEDPTWINTPSFLLHNSLTAAIDPEQFVCDICNKIFTETHFLQRHLIYHSLMLEPSNAPDRTHKVIVESNSNIQNQVDTGLCDAKMEVMDKNYSAVSLSQNNSKALDMDHITTIEEEECKYCKELIPTIHLSRHVHLEHKDIYRRECRKFRYTFHKCHECPIGYLNVIPQMLKHMQIQHEPKYKCNYCDKLFSRNKTFVSHKNRFHAQSPAKREKVLCHICGKIFQNIKVHIFKAHTYKKSFKCTINVCNAVFQDRKSLRNHIKVFHKIDPLCICEHCGKQLKRRKLAVHMRKHTDIIPYNCTICKRGFMLQRNLRKHMKIYDSMKPYTCAVCPEMFHEKKGLKKHCLRYHRKHELGQNILHNRRKRIVVKSSEKSMECGLCLMKFANGANFNKHFRTCHPLVYYYNRNRRQL